MICGGELSISDLFTSWPLGKSRKISTSTAHRYFARFEAMGQVEPSGPAGLSSLKLLDKSTELYIPYFWYVLRVSKFCDLEKFKQIKKVCYYSFANEMTSHAQPIEVYFRVPSHQMDLDQSGGFL